MPVLWILFLMYTSPSFPPSRPLLILLVEYLLIHPIRHQLPSIAHINHSSNYPLLPFQLPRFALLPPHPPFHRPWPPSPHQQTDLGLIKPVLERVIHVLYVSLPLCSTRPSTFRTPVCACNGFISLPRLRKRCGLPSGIIFSSS